MAAANPSDMPVGPMQLSLEAAAFTAAFAAVSRCRSDTTTERRNRANMAIGLAVLVAARAIGLMQTWSRSRRLRAARADRQLTAAAAEGSATEAGSMGAEPMSDAALVSERVRLALANDETPIQNLNHFMRLMDPVRYPAYDRWRAPDGYISAAIAENKCCESFMPYLQHRPGLGDREMGYNNFNGMEHVRKAVAEFYDQYICGRSIAPERILMTAGANMALDSLFYSIANPGDYCLLATPYYAAFKWDLGLKSGVLIHPVVSDASNNFELDLGAYKRALADARAAGRVVKAVLICNPNNPLGTCMSRTQLREIADWVASEKDLHLVADEIYALSIFGNRLPAAQQGPLARLFCPLAAQPSPFVSLANVLTAAEMKDRFHIIYAFSKDFGLSGFRCGLIYTENDSVVKAFNQLSQFNGLSTDVQHFFYLLLTDRTALPNYVDRMQTQMAEVVCMLQGELDAAGIPYVRGQAALFLWIDLTAFLDAPTVDAELRLYNDILAHCNVNLTPGSVFHSPQPGWFRFCHSAAPFQTMRVAIRRITAFLKQRKLK